MHAGWFLPQAEKNTFDTLIVDQPVRLARLTSIYLLLKFPLSNFLISILIKCLANFDKVSCRKDYLGSCSSKMIYYLYGHEQWNVMIIIYLNEPSV